MRLKRSVRAVSAGLACLALSVVPIVRATDQDAPKPSREQTVHTDAAGIEAAMGDAVKAFVEDDLKAARAALDRIEKGSPSLELGDPDAVDSKILAHDRGFHVTLDRSREHAGAGEADQAFDQFVWVMRTCRNCHRVAREQRVAPVDP